MATLAKCCATAQLGSCSSERVAPAELVGGLVTGEALARRRRLEERRFLLGPGMEGMLGGS